MVDALVAVAGTLLGAAVGVRGALVISRAERLDATREDVRRTLAGYLGALYPAVAELRELSPRRELPLLVRWLQRPEPSDVAWARQRWREYRGYG